LFLHERERQYNARMRPRWQKLIDVVLRSPEGHGELRRGAYALATSLAGVVSDPTGALPAALASWAERVTRHAWRATDEEVEALRRAGFDEDVIFETTPSRS